VFISFNAFTTAVDALNKTFNPFNRSSKEARIVKEARDALRERYGVTVIYSLNVRYDTEGPDGWMAEERTVGFFKTTAHAEMAGEERARQEGALWEAPGQDISSTVDVYFVREEELHG
jgi:hypothetical protein